MTNTLYTILRILETLILETCIQVLVTNTRIQVSNIYRVSNKSLILETCIQVSITNTENIRDSNIRDLYTSIRDSSL